MMGTFETTRSYDGYSAHYRWEWFGRKEWRGSFRQRKRHSSEAFAELVRERGLGEKYVLDCSCGLGLKTIVMKEAGLKAQGSDECALAVECARLLAEEECIDIEYFVSSWAELPQKTDTRYPAIFNDALSWVYSEDEMTASLKGLHDCLLPGGILVYMGALPGTDTNQDEILEHEWQERTANGRHQLGMQASDGRTSVQEVVCFEKGLDFIDEHHLYVIEEDGARHLDNWRLRCTVKWGWPRIQEFLRDAGFCEFGTKEFVAANGRPFHLVLAIRD